ncbi:hypothetical protein MJT46_000567 [Ovis ammon polii x Ovis aries]|nr:hypothetical protein MJT46_000567 [Ovis ammon polii x Ovis aries]
MICKFQKPMKKNFDTKYLGTERQIPSINTPVDSSSKTEFDSEILQFFQPYILFNGTKYQAFPNISAYKWTPQVCYGSFTLIDEVQKELGVPLKEHIICKKPMTTDSFSVNHTELYQELVEYEQQHTLYEIASEATATYKYNVLTK